MDRFVAPLILAFTVTMFATVWKIFTKAGHKGWKSLVPIYGGVVFLRIVERPWWMLLLLAIPGVNLFPYIICCIELARVFGRGGGFAAGLTFLPPVFLMILAFGEAKYRSLKAPAISPALARAYPEHANYPERPAYSGRTDHPERVAYPGRTAYPERATNPERPNYPERSTYPERPAYPERAASPGPAAHPERAASPEGSAYPDRTAHPERPANPERAADPNRPNYPDRAA